jgi:hypothetical protein
MAIGTATAATLGAISAGVGIAATAGTTAMSFAQAGKQRKLQRQAEAEAAEAMSAARKKLDVNFYEQLAIQKEPYELEREALLSAGAQAIAAGQESERGAAATAGRVYMAQQAGQRQIAGAMGQEMLGLEKATAAEDARLAGAQAGLDLATAQGAQLAARDAQQAASLATQQGVAGVTSLAGQVASALPLYNKSASARQFGKLEEDYSKAVNAGTLGYQFRDDKGNPLSFQQAMGKMSGFGIDMSGVTGMKPLEFQDYIIKQNAGNLKDLRASGFGGDIIKNTYNPTQVAPFERYMLDTISRTYNPFQIMPFEQQYGPK